MRPTRTRIVGSADEAPDAELLELGKPGVGQHRDDAVDLVRVGTDLVARTSCRGAARAADSTYFSPSCTDALLSPHARSPKR